MAEESLPRMSIVNELFSRVIKTGNPTKTNSPPQKKKETRLEKCEILEEDE